MSDIELQKLPPQSIDAEEYFLSACMLGSAQEGSELLTPDEFYRTAHQKIFTVIQDLVQNNSEVDLATVVSKIRFNGELEEIGGAAYISRIIDTVPASRALVDYAKIIRSCAQKRAIIKSCADTITQCYGPKPVSEILGELDLSTSEIKTHSGIFYKLGDILPDMLDQWEDMTNNPGLPGIPCGLSDIDRAFGGFQMGLYVIGGRPGMGKTSLGMRIARGAAQLGFPSLQISLEMSKEQLACREISCASGIDGERFVTGNLNNGHWARIADACMSESDLPIYINDDPSATINEVQSKMRQFAKKHGKCIILIDYLDYIRGLKSDRKDLEIGTVTKGLKASAKILNVPVVLFVQLNRQCESRTNKRPEIHDLRNSGEIEQDADVIAFIYRDEVYNKDTDDKGIAEFIIRKFRQGRTQTVKLAYIAHRTTFENLARG